MQSQLVESLETRTLFSLPPLIVGGGSYDSAFRSVSDPDGNTIVAGLFSGTADFRLGPGTTTLTAVGETDIFVAKYSPDGVPLWVRQFGGIEGGDLDLDDADQIVPITINPQRAGESLTGVGTVPLDLGEFVTGLTLDATGGILLVGAFRGAVDFDPGAGQTVLRTDEEFADAFLLRLTGDGDLSFARQVGGQFNDVANDVAAAPDGNFFITGYFTRSADFDTSGSTRIVGASGRADIFVAKYSVNGLLKWVSTAGSDTIRADERESGNAIALCPCGDVTITGSFAGEADFNPRRSLQRLVESAGKTDAFVARYDGNSGSLEYVKTTGGEDYDAGIDIAWGLGNTFYTVGYFENEADVDPGAARQIMTATPEDEGDDPEFTDLVVSRFDRSGNLLWASQLRGTGYETVGGLLVDYAGNAYIAGAFSGTADFNPSRNVDRNLTSLAGDGDFDDDRNQRDRERSYDAFLWKLSNNGRFKDAGSFGGAGDDFLTGIALDPFDNVTVVGRLNAPADLAPGIPSISSGRGAGREDAFLGVYDANLDLLS